MSGSAAAVAMPGEPVLTLQDLRHRSFPGTALAVLGHPIGHSLSPRMHNAALARLAERDFRYAAWRYYRFDVPPADLPEALDAFAGRGFLGLNLTVPHKVIAFDRIGAVDPAARPVGAVNTLRRGSGGGWEGYNTDGYGLAAGLRAAFGAELGGRPVILLGAGGAARGAAVECLARGCASLQVGNRTPENLSPLLALLRAGAGAIPVRGFDPARPEGLPAGAWLINATSAGLRPGDPAPIDLDAVPKPAGVYDMIYHPAETALLQRARALGIPAANGLGMLVHQGAKALEIWSGVPAAETAPWMEAALS